jgi:hypothetical protein
MSFLKVPEFQISTAIVMIFRLYYGGRQSQRSFLFTYFIFSMSLTPLHVSARAGHLQANTIVS